jgi:hypothetical protein
LPSCFSSFLSSRLIAAKMSIEPPREIYRNQGTRTRLGAGSK